MIFLISYQTKRDAADAHSNFTRSFFAEHPNNPSLEMVGKLVDQVSHGDFDGSTIEIEESLDFDAKEMKKQGTNLHKFG